MRNFVIRLACISMLNFSRLALSEESALSADVKSHWEESPASAKPFTLADTMDRASHKSQDILKDEWDARSNQLGIEDKASECFPKAEINSGFYYNDGSDSQSLSDSFLSSMSIRWDLFEAWKIFFQKKYLQHNEAYRKLKHGQALRTSKAKALALYFNYWSQSHSLDMASEEKALAGKKLSNARFSFEKKLLPKKSLDESARAFEEGSWEYDGALLKTSQAKKKLLRYLFLPPNTEIAPPSPIPLPEVPSLDTVIRKTMEASEALLSSKENLQNSNQAIEDSRYKRWTQFRTSFYVGNSIPLNQWYQITPDQTLFYGAELKWVLPLLDGGYYKRQEKEAVIHHEKALLDHENLPDEIFEKITEMWRDLIEKRKKILVAQESCEDQEEAFQPISQKYVSGELSLIEKETARLDLKRQKLQLTLKNYDYIVTHANLDIFCGNETSWIMDNAKQGQSESEAFSDPHSKPHRRSPGTF